MDISNLRIPEPLNIYSNTLAEDYLKWRKQINVYLTACGADEKPKKVIKCIILNCAGPGIISAAKQFVYAEGEHEEDPGELLKKIAAYCNPQKHESLDAYLFWNIDWKPGTSFDYFLTELRSKADPCNFGTMKDRLLRDKIIFSVPARLHQVLLRENPLTLDKAVQICRSFDASQTQSKQMHRQQDNVVYKVAKREEAPTRQFNSARHFSKKVDADTVTDCRFCGLRHKKVKSLCPAYGKTCSKCGGRNHFRVKCHSKVHKVQKDAESALSSTEEYLHAIKPKEDVERLTALLQVNDCQVRFELDTGANVNTICKKFVRKEQVKPCFRTLTMWNKSAIHVAGETTLDIVNARSNDVCPVNFLVVNNDLQCLLGLDTVRRMNLVTVNSDAFIATVTDDNLGHLGYPSLTVDPAPISEPTQWVSQMAIVNKKNGSLRICIDPQPLNTALKREHFKLPTLDDILPELHNAKVFSELDVSHAYWHVELDDNSSKLTTMMTSFGRYRWKRLPFGLKVSSEIFQRKLNDTIFDLPGVFAVADDVIVIGRGVTHENALIDHDANLHKLYERCREKHIMLNDEKADMRKTEITFMGHLITQEGIQADPTKITAIPDMPSPTEIHGVKRFCGMIQYLARFLPNLAQMSEPLRH